MNNQKIDISKKEEFSVTPALKGQTLDTPLLSTKKEEIKQDEAIVSQDPSLGINLIPTLSKEEVVIENKKKSLNVGSILSLLVLVLISIGIVGFNIFSKIQLNREKENLYSYEKKIHASDNKIVASNEITERVSLYKSIQAKSYSARKVIDYLNTIAKKSGNAKIKTFEFGNDLTFSFEGEGEDLENVSKFWYLLTIDPKIEGVTLRNFGSGVGNVKFTFEGKLKFEQFLDK